MLQRAQNYKDIRTVPRRRTSIDPSVHEKMNAGVRISKNHSPEIDGIHVFAIHSAPARTGYFAGLRDLWTRHWSRRPAPRNTGAEQTSAPEAG